MMLQNSNGFVIDWWALNTGGCRSLRIRKLLSNFVNTSLQRNKTCILFWVGKLSCTLLVCDICYLLKTVTVYEQVKSTFLIWLHKYLHVEAALTFVWALYRLSVIIFCVRSPWSNQYFPALNDGAVPSDKLRQLEIEANAAFDIYRDMYVLMSTFYSILCLSSMHAWCFCLTWFIQM